MNTVEGRAAPLEGMLRRIVSGRGVEAFILTASESEEDLKRVASAVTALREGSRKPLRTRHSGLAKHLR